MPEQSRGQGTNGLKIWIKSDKKTE